jgi:hypothetical protein
VALLPVIAADVKPLVAEPGGPAPYSAVPIPSLYSQDSDWRLPFLQI